MKRLFLLIGIAITFFVGVTVDAQATLIRFAFEGKLNSFKSLVSDPVSDPVSVAFKDKYLGAPFTGDFEIQYDPYQMPSSFLSSTVWFFPMRYQINISDFSFGSGPSLSDGSFWFYPSTSEFVYGDDTVLSNNFPISYSSDSTGIWFQDDTNTPFSDILSPTGLPISIDASKFSRGSFGVVFSFQPQEALGMTSPNGDYLSLGGSFNVTNHSVHPVPEPDTIVLIGAGILGFAVWGRKRFQNGTDIKASQ